MRKIIIGLNILLLIFLVGCGETTIDPNKNPNDQNQNQNQVDDLEPILVLNGDSSIYLEVGDIYTDLGAYIDNADDFDNLPIIEITNEVNANTPGVYEVVYNVFYNDKNYEIVRTVIVNDRLIPVLTLNGDSVIELYVGTMYTDPGAYIENNEQFDTPLDITIIDDINRYIPGNYTVTYSVTYNGEVYKATRTVRVIEQQQNEGTLFVSFASSSATDSSITVNFDIVNNNVTLDKVEVMLILQGVEVSMQEFNTPGNHTVTFTGLSSSTYYEVDYRAIYHNGITDVTDDNTFGSFQTSSTTNICPSPSFGFSDVDVTTSSLSFTIIEVSDVNPNTGYVIELSYENNVIQTITTDSLEIEFTGLDSNTHYDIMVKAEYVDCNSMSIIAEIYTTSATTLEDVSITLPYTEDFRWDIQSNNVTLTFQLLDPDFRLTEKEYKIVDLAGNIIKQGQLYTPYNQIFTGYGLEPNTTYRLLINVSYLGEDDQVVQVPEFVNIQFTTAADVILLDFIQPNYVLDQEDLILALDFSSLEDINPLSVTLNGTVYTTVFTSGNTLFVNTGIDFIDSETVNLQAMTIEYSSEHTNETTHTFNYSDSLVVIRHQLPSTPDDAFIDVIDFSIKDRLIRFDDGELSDTYPFYVEVNNLYGLEVTSIYINDTSYSATEFTQVSDRLLRIDLPILYGEHSHVLHHVSYTDALGNPVTLSNIDYTERYRTYYDSEVTYVSTPTDWDAISNDNRIYVLTNDISLLGVDSRIGTDFDGVIDGNGYTVTGVNHYLSSSFDYFDNNYSYGVIRHVNNAMILNINFDSIYISIDFHPELANKTYGGGLFNSVSDSVIENVHIVGSTNTISYSNLGISRVGSISAYLMESEVKNVSSNVTMSLEIENTSVHQPQQTDNYMFVNQEYSYGGIFGYVFRSQISKVVNYGTITQTGDNTKLALVGGIAGMVRESDISYVTNHGDISATYGYVGGIVAYSSELDYAMNTGDISLTKGLVGGIVGLGGLHHNYLLNTGDVSIVEYYDVETSIGYIYGNGNNTTGFDHAYYSESATIYYNGVSSFGYDQTADNIVIATELELNNTDFYIQKMMLPQSMYDYIGFNTSVDEVVDFIR